MRAKILPNGNLYVPLRAEAADGTIGDGMAEIDPTHAQYASWYAYLRDSA
jgi:hypothetical protein